MPDQIFFASDLCIPVSFWLVLKNAKISWIHILIPNAKRSKTANDCVMCAFYKNHPYMARRFRKLSVPSLKLWKVEIRNARKIRCIGRCAITFILNMKMRKPGHTSQNAWLTGGPEMQPCFHLVAPHSDGLVAIAVLVTDLRCNLQLAWKELQIWAVKMATANIPRSGSLVAIWGAMPEQRKPGKTK